MESRKRLDAHNLTEPNCSARTSTREYDDDDDDDDDDDVSSFKRLLFWGKRFGNSSLNGGGRNDVKTGSKYPGDERLHNFSTKVRHKDATRALTTSAGNGGSKLLIQVCTTTTHDDDTRGTRGRAV